MSSKQPSAGRRILRESIRGRGRDLRALAAWSALEALPAFLSGRLVAEAIDDGFLAGDTGTGFAWLGVLAASVVLGAWATRQTWLRLAAVVEPLRDELVTGVAAGALQRATRAGAVRDPGGVARVTRQVEIVREAYASVLLVVQGFLVTTVGALLGLLTLAPEILLLVVPPLVLGLALFAHAIPRMAERQRASILAEERIAEVAGGLAIGQRDVVACGAEDVAGAMVGRHIEEQAAATRELARFTALRTVAVAVGGLLPIVLILAAGPWLVDRGASTGTILGALTYVAAGVHPALQTLVRGIGGAGLWLMVALARVAEMSSGRSTLQPGRTAARSPRNDLRLTNVSFAYGPATAPVISDLDLTVPEGDHLAIVGPSGVGKSTLANLIAGVLRPQSGAVRLGGVALEELGMAALAARRVLIPQEAYVVAGTLRENLTYLRLDASDEDLDRAVAALGMGRLVERIGGYDAVVDPAALSAGERQAVTLVRAYVSGAAVAVLDEASCHLDPAAEAVVERAFAARGGTTIVIAHRMSSALRARRVLVLDGEDVLLGPHADLLERSAPYRDLVGHWQGAGAASGGDDQGLKLAVR